MQISFVTRIFSFEGWRLHLKPGRPSWRLRYNYSAIFFIQRRCIFQLHNLVIKSLDPDPQSPKIKDPHPRIHNTVLCHLSVDSAIYMAGQSQRKLSPTLSSSELVAVLSSVIAHAVSLWKNIQIY
jgi:hypothetical protein